MRTLLLASLTTLCACSADPISSTTDLASPSPDMARPVDAAGPDLTAAPIDLASTPDLAAAPDLRDPGGKVCGGFGGGACPPNSFCDITDQCGWADASGVCVEIPVACDKVLDPVCGCDGKVYGNDCERQQAGVSRFNKGICGCQMQCGPKSYCAQCRPNPACIPIGAAC